MMPLNLAADGTMDLPFRAEGGRRPSGDARAPRDLVAILQTERKALSSGWLQILDAEAVAGWRHLASAYDHADRARRQGRAHFDDPGAELTLYAAGTDQWDVAVGRVGLSTTTTEVVLVASPPRDLGPIWQRLGLLPDPRVFPRAPTPRTLERLGYLPEEQGAIAPERWELLALEAVAQVDLPRATPSARRAGSA